MPHHVVKSRGDHIGVLQAEAHAAFGNGNLPREQLKEAEDRAILAAFDLQREVGLDIFSDGEYRRSNWAGDFISSVDGYLLAELLSDLADLPVDQDYLAQLRAALAITPHERAHCLLTPREQEALRLLSAGLSNRAIAGRLIISEGTLKRHLSNIYLKLEVHSRTQALARAAELGLL